MTLVGYEAFSDCTGLDSITFTGEKVPNFNGYAFKNVIADAYYPFLPDSYGWDSIRENPESYQYGGTINWIETGRKNGWEEAGGYWYYYDDGEMVRNCIYGVGDGYMAEFNENGVWIGGYRYDGTKWIEYGEGEIITGWKQDEYGNWYYYDNNGIIVTGWKKLNGYWYYFEPINEMGYGGYMRANVWKKDSKGWCYLGADGRMVANEWAKDRKGWCWIGEEGYMIEKDMWIGEEGQSGSSYIIKGYRVDNHTITINGTMYTFDADGKLIP